MRMVHLARRGCAWFALIACGLTPACGADDLEDDEELVAESEAPLQATGRPTAETLPYLNVRLGRPLVVRGPVANELDGPFNVVQLSKGQFRGFTGGGGSSYGIRG